VPGSTTTFPWLPGRPAVAAAVSIAAARSALAAANWVRAATTAFWARGLAGLGTGLVRSSPVSA